MCNHHYFFSSSSVILSFFFGIGACVFSRIIYMYKYLCILDSFLRFFNILYQMSQFYLLYLYRFIICPFKINVQSVLSRFISFHVLYPYTWSCLKKDIICYARCIQLNFLLIGTFIYLLAYFQPTFRN